MNRFIFLSTCFIVLVFTACNSDGKKNKGLNNPIKDAVATSPHNNDYRANALSILDFRNKKTEGKSFSIIEADTWEYEFVYTKGNMSKEGEYTGIWVDFKPDMNYSYGKNKLVEGTGKYHYDSDEAVLLMIDDDVSKKPQEWTAKFAGDAMVLVGTNSYNDNSIQMKLARVADSVFQ